MSGVTPGLPRRVVVVGGGVAGLAAAHRLRSLLGPAAEVVLCEAAGHVGGALRTVELAGHALDVGAEAFLARRPELPALLAELGLADRQVHPSRAVPAVVAGGRLHPLPRRTLMGVPAATAAVAELLTPAGRARAHRAAPVAWHAGADPTVAELVGSSLGPEVVARSVDPLLGGVYSGSAASLGVRAAVPALAAALDRAGAADPGAPLDLLAAVADALPATPAPGPVFGALEGGYRVLLDALLAAGHPEVRLRTTATALTRTATGWRVGLRGPAGTPAALDADAVVLAVPAPVLGRLLADAVPAAAAEAGAVELGSSVVVALAYRATDVAGALPATSGALVATGEPRHAKAFTHSSRKWPHLDDGATVLLRASLGRFGDAAVLGRDDADLVELVRADLAALHGLAAAPVDTAVARWPGGLPQYAPGHLERVGRLLAAVAGVPGLAVAGSLLHGVGVPATVGSARAAAERVAAGPVAPPA